MNGLDHGSRLLRADRTGLGSRRATAAGQGQRTSEHEKSHALVLHCSGHSLSMSEKGGGILEHWFGRANGLWSLWRGQALLSDITIALNI
ncbi:hypothetical protein D3C72_1664850 [compost metagenome]